MSLIIPKKSDEFILNLILGKKNSNGQQYLRLYKNDMIPTRDTLLADISQADQGGYYPISLDQSYWIINTVSGITSASYPEQTFVLEESASIYGYYITTFVDSVEYLMWLERFKNAPFQLPSVGGSISINLNIGVS